MLTPEQVLFFRNQAVILWEQLINKFSSQYYVQVLMAPELKIDCPTIESDDKIVFICFLIARRIRDDTTESSRGRYFIVSKKQYYDAYLCTKKNLTLTIENSPWQARYGEVPE